jgi:hypothetical protein
MTNAPKEKWISCVAPVVADTLRWQEPLWDKPNKPRGRPDKIGEQMVTATLKTLTHELAELQVIDVTRLSLIAGAQDVPARIKKDDIIRRKVSSIKSGDCHKLLQEA